LKVNRNFTPPNKTLKPPYILIPLVFDPTLTKWYFDGASQGTPGISGIGCWFILPSRGKLSFKLGNGREIINRDKLIVVDTLLDLGTEKSYKFQYISFMHLYRKFIIEANQLGKEVV
jgi:hypothetical protein